MKVIESECNIDPYINFVFSFIVLWVKYITDFELFCLGGLKDDLLWQSVPPRVVGHHFQSSFQQQSLSKHQIS